LIIPYLGYCTLDHLNLLKGSGTLRKDEEEAVFALLMVLLRSLEFGMGVGGSGAGMTIVENVESPELTVVSCLRAGRADFPWC